MFWESLQIVFFCFSDETKEIELTGDLNYKCYCETSRILRLNNFEIYAVVFHATKLKLGLETI